MMSAMVKQIQTLQDNGTYEEVAQKIWMPVIDMMWVVQRGLEDDGKNSGDTKARLLVRGDLDRGEDDIPCDSPTVDRTTIKVMLSVAANQGFEVRSLNISAAFLQGRQIDRDVYVRPPPKF